MKANCYLVGKGELEMFSSNTHSARILCRMADNLGFMDSGNIKARKNKDLESLCFDCGSTDGLIVKSEGSHCVLNVGQKMKQKIRKENNDDKPSKRTNTSQ